MKRLTATIGLALGLMAGAAQAAPITWGAATDIAGASDVFTLGTSVYAYALGRGDPVGGGIDSFSGATVNGVSFARGSGSGGGTDITIFGAQAAGRYFPLSSPADYNDILSAAAFGNTGGTPTPPTMTVTLNNLIAGHVYAVQVWSANVDYGGTPTTYDGAVSLKVRPGSDQTGTGQYAIGTFTADAAFQVMTLTEANFQINALQLRDVPEPATAALLMLGGLAILRRKRV